MEDIEQIRQTHFREGKSMRKIAQEHHHTHRVVRQALREAVPRHYTMKQPRSSLAVGPVVPFMEQWLSEDQQRPKEQRHTAHRIRNGSATRTNSAEQKALSAVTFVNIAHSLCGHVPKP